MHALSTSDMELNSFCLLFIFRINVAQKILHKIKTQHYTNTLLFKEAKQNKSKNLMKL